MDVKLGDSAVHRHIRLPGYFRRSQEGIPVLRLVVVLVAMVSRTFNNH